MSGPSTPPARPAEKPRRCNRLVALTGLSLLVGCSNYESKWKAAGDRPIPPGDIAGRWQGEWVSEANTHCGGLRCVLTRTGPDTYRADYRATYWKIFSFGYSMDLHAGRREGETTYFGGAADLGWLAGGEYRYDGHATPEAFYSRVRVEERPRVFRDEAAGRWSC